jgi:hypothetical protein
MATLLIELPGGVSQVHRLAERRLVLGRSRDADINVPARGVSRLHCEIVRGTAGEYTLADLGSKNGTRVNDHPVERATLRDQDAIIVGEARLIFRAADSSSAAAAATGGGAAPESPRPASRPPERWVEPNSEALFEGNEGDDTFRLPAETGEVVELARRAEELEEALRRTRYLADALADFAGASTRARLFERLAGRLRESFRLERVSLLAPDGETNWRLEYFSDRSGLGSEMLPLAREAAGRVRASRAPMMISMGGGLSAGASGDSKRRKEGARVFLLAPVVADKEFLGVLQADSAMAETMPGKRDLELFQVVAEALGARLAGLRGSGSFPGAPIPPGLGNAFPPAFAASAATEEVTGPIARPEPRPAMVEGAVLLARAFPPASWTAKGLVAVSERLERLRLLEELFALAVDVAHEFGGVPAGSVGGQALFVFLGSMEGAAGSQQSSSRSAAEAAVSFLAALADWRERRGGEDRIPGAGVAAASGEISFLRESAASWSGVDCFGEPLARVMAASALLRPDRALLDAETRRRLGPGTPLGTFAEATLVSWDGWLAGDWRELLWKG